MELSEKAVREMVRRVVLRTIGPDGIQAPAAPSATAGGPSPKRTITEGDVAAVAPGGKLPVPASALVTPLARDTARDRRVELVAQPAERPAAAAPSGRGASTFAQPGVVALGADHGGFALKQDLKAYVAELGYQVIDCGTHSTAAVDYPDVAYAVAQLVASGHAWRGIMVDGAGIGSCMAANKVPGIRAAMCYDHATAVNSRQHNDANVLTLGGTLIGSNLARQIVQVWLETSFGGERHARRVDKITAIERRYAK
jgi:ribose 5-phosphate isomerase B